ncbi:hypothetical protein [Methylocapsa sp. S129]|uniref:Nmad2 family putative nucleotide modification protein n=1 Tax=Methylocapsa sp. S129 TaxID=1641869 RepID=UPI00131E8662|nr:hypothetical protein [Methylocapsa sp. S129]
MAKVYIYVVARDFGFAPNPFHGVCTLATCKPVIRRTAQVGDWVIGMGGSKLKAVGRCIFAMQVTDALTFDEYWAAPEYRAKQPVRNGSRKTIVGDNIYHHTAAAHNWHQEDSHHSQPDGAPDPSNIQHDTQTDRVLISDHFLYFGKAAPLVPEEVLRDIGFHNRVGHRVYPLADARPLLSWLNEAFGSKVNHVLGDPFQFTQSSARYSKRVDRII